MAVDAVICSGLRLPSDVLRSAGKGVQKERFLLLLLQPRDLVVQREKEK